MLKLTLLDKWGALPAAGDRHVAEFVPWVLTEASGWGADYNVELTSIARREKHQQEYIADVDAWLGGTKDLQTWPSGELPALVIDSLVSGSPPAAGNIPNAGQVPDVPADAVVESICMIDGEASAAGTWPSCRPLRRVGAAARRGERAHRSRRPGGRPSLADAAFFLDPLAGRGDLHRTEEMVDELLAATAKWLPQFSR